MSITTLLFYCFIAATGVQILYYLFYLFNFALKTPRQNRPKHLPVSVIICAKNEAENLKQYLPFFIDQKHSNFELVLVNDGSWDDTLEVMEAFQNNHDNIKVVDVKPIEQFWGNKKYALTLGIKAASHDFLLFTDADCKPSSQNWISEMSANFSNSKSIILGYGAYQRKASFLNKLIRYETLLTAIQYFSYANAGMPYMGVGRNLAYRKELFFNHSGFMKHMQINSGDDDLFVNQVATSKNTALCYSKQSVTISKPKTNFKDWIVQKRRHISTAKHYKSVHKLLLGLFYVSQLLFWGLAIVLLLLQYQWMAVSLLVASRFLLHITTIGLSAKKLNEKHLVLLAPFLELFLIVAQLAIFSANLISKPKHWK